MAGGISYPSSWTDIANRALSKFPTDLISNLSDGSPNANRCALHLGQAVEDIFGVLDWNGVTERATLAPLVDVPEFGFNYYYQLPSDFLRPITVDCGGSAYSIEKDRVLTDAEEVTLVYVAKPAEVNKIPSYMRNAIIARLAFLLTPALTSNEKTAARIAAEYTDAINQAIAQDVKRTDETTPADELGFTWNDELR